jgi:predicted Zn-dependent protease
LLAGAAEYQLGSLSTAEDHLKRVLAAFPNSLYARNLLVATYLRKGQARKAEDVIAPALKQAPMDPLILRSAGEIAFANNQVAEAAAYYERAIAVEKDNTSLRTRLAQIRLASGDSNRALDDLERIAGLDRDQYQADLSLISALLRRKEFDKALTAVAALEKKQPDNPLTHTARGTVFVAKKDLNNARVHLEKALALQFNYLPAARILAGLDIADKKSPAARARFGGCFVLPP